MSDPSYLFQSYDRGQQAVIIDGATGNVTQTGTAAPTTATVWGLTPFVTNGEIARQIGVQIDATNTLAGNVNILGSLDGVNFYVVKTIAVTAATGSLTTFNLTTKYICASLTSTSGSGTITVSFSA